MKESSELGRILQKTYTPEALQEDSTIDSHDTGNTVSSTGNQFCDLREVRTNPGDDLFAGEITADLHYQAIVTCPPFYNGDSYQGLFCQSIGGTCHPGTYSEYSCDTIWGRVDCPHGSFCGSSCNQNCLTQGQLCEVNGVPSGPDCCSSLYCPGIGIPGTYYECEVDNSFSATDPPNQNCSVDVLVTLDLITKTPLADDVWARLVAGPASVFKKIFPKIDEHAPVTSIWDIPAATRVSYTGPGIVRIGTPGSGRTQPELYFPHIGGIHQYFLNCIQTALRPKGFGNPCISAPPDVPVGAPPGPVGGTGVCGVYDQAAAVPPYPTRGGSCQPGVVGWCSISTLTSVLRAKGENWTPEQIRIAGIICNRESGGWTNALNDGCLCGRSCDFSIGLFQINALPGRCPDAFDAYGGTDWNCDFNTHTYWCTPKSDAAAQACIDYWSDPSNNIDKLITLSNHGTCWRAWRTLTNTCGIPNTSGC